MQLQTKQLWIFIALALLMAATRFNHFGSAISLPDASLAVFLLAGFTLSKSSLKSLFLFIFLLLEAGAIDYYAINMAGVSDWCVTPAYFFLIPTYATMWFGGHWFAMRQQNSRASLALFGGVSWLSTTLAFMISNGSFYLLSGRYTEMSATDYMSYVTQYYPFYVTASLAYIALCSGIFILMNKLTKNSQGTLAG